MNSVKYGIGADVNLAYEDAIARVREALASEGFGVLTEIDVKETLKKKIDVDFRPYVILGACNPGFAHQALNAEIDIGLLLPCNVVVYAGDEAGKSTVAIMDPVMALEMSDNDQIRPLAHEVKSRLERVLERVKA